MKDQNLNYLYLPALKTRLSPAITPHLNRRDLNTLSSQNTPGKATLLGKNMLQNWNISVNVHGRMSHISVGKWREEAVGEWA